MTSTSADGEIVHTDPVWRDRSNFIIAAEIEPVGDIKTEQLWARRLGDRTFEVCCIPFFVYDLALGDVVETDGEFVIRRILQRSGRYVFRVWLERDSKNTEELVKALEARGSAIEWSSRHLLGVDVSDESQAQSVADYLANHERHGNLRFETGRS